MSVQKVSWFNDETPSGPNYAGGCESDILGERETFSWSSKVTDAGEDNAPLSRINCVVLLVIRSIFVGVPS